MGNYTQKSLRLDINCPSNLPNTNGKNYNRTDKLISLNLGCDFFFKRSCFVNIIKTVEKKSLNPRFFLYPLTYNSQIVIFDCEHILTVNSWFYSILSRGRNKLNPEEGEVQSCVSVINSDKDVNNNIWETWIRTR